MRLANKVAIVTGAASGIGKAIAELFAEEGAQVVTVDWNPDSDCFHADVSRALDAGRMVESAVGRYGGLDILVNNAAVQVLAPLVDTREEDWDRVHGVNLKGVFLGSKYALPAMLRRGGGAIVNISSILAFVGDPDLPAYSATKGGIISLTKSMAMAYGPRGIRVNCICPGDVNTPMVREFFANAPDPEAFRREVYSKYALGRIAEPREVAQAALFLASDASSFITGAVLVVDGGLTSKCY